MAIWTATGGFLYTGIYGSVWNAHRPYSAGERVAYYQNDGKWHFYIAVADVAAGGVPSGNGWTGPAYVGTPWSIMNMTYTTERQEANITNVSSDHTDDFKIVGQTFTFDGMLSWNDQLTTALANSKFDGQDDGFDAPVSMVATLGSSGLVLFAPKAIISSTAFVIDMNAPDRIIALRVSGHGSSRLLGPGTNPVAV